MMNMDVIIFNGSLKNGNQHLSIQRSIEKELTSIGVEWETIILNSTDLKSCIGCFKCWDTTPGICTGIKGDSGNEIIRKVIQSKMIVYLTPLTFGGFSSELKKMIERFLPLLQAGVVLVKGETHHRKRYDKYPSILAIATTDEKDEEEVEIFKHLMHRLSLNFYPPKYIAEVLDLKEDEKVVEKKLSQYLVELEVGK